MSDNLKNRGIIAFIWDFFGKLASNGMGFIISIFLARLLEPSEFGLIAMVMVVIGITTIFTDSGLGVALIQRRRILPVHYSSVFYFNIVIAITLGLLTFFSADLFAQFYNNDELVSLTKVMSFTFIITALSSVQSIRLRKELNYALLTKITFIATLISGVLGIFLAVNGAGVWSLVTQNLALGIINSLLLCKVSKWRPSLMFSLKALRQLWSFGFHIFLTNLLDAIFTRLDVLIIGKLFSPTILGFYNRAKALDQLIVSYASGSLMSVLFPILSKVQNDLSRFQNIVIKAYAIISFVIFLLLGTFYLTSEEIIVLLFTEKWLPSVIYFKILILTGFSLPLSVLLMSILTSRGKSKLFLRLSIYKKVLFSINLYVGFTFGIEGYLYGLVIVSIIGLLINIYYGAKEIDLSVLLFLRSAAIQLIISVSSVFITKVLTQDMEYNNFVMLVCKSSIFVMIYILCSWVLKTDPHIFFYEQFGQIIEKIRNRKV